MSAIRYCSQQNPKGANVENFVVDNGGLENVFVYVKDGLGNYDFDTPTEPVKLDQKGCHYAARPRHPRRAAARDLNSDDTLHNVHAHGEGEPRIQQGQPMQGMKNDDSRSRSPK